MDPLRGERLEMTPFSAADVDTIVALLHQPGVRRYLCDDLLFPREMVAGFQSESDDTFASRKPGLWVARLADEDRVVGLIGFRPIDGEDEVELIFAIDEQEWRRGYASEGTRLAMAWATENCGQTRFLASTDEPNHASVMTLEYLGFVRTGKKPPSEGQVHPQIWFELTS